jgi:hypothetical protein
MGNELLYQVMIAVFSAGSTYAAIRADLKSLHEKILDHKDIHKELKSDVTVLHGRINDIIKDK